MLTPVGKRLLVKPEEIINNKIILTNSKPTRFEVVAKGEEVTKVPVGCLIYISKFSGVDIEYEGQKFMVVEENDVIAMTPQ